MVVTEDAARVMATDVEIVGDWVFDREPCREKVS